MTKLETMKKAKDLYLRGRSSFVCNNVRAALGWWGDFPKHPMFAVIEADILEFLDGEPTVGMWLGVSDHSHGEVERQYRVAIFDTLIARYEQEETRCEHQN